MNRSAADVRRAHAAGRIACLIGVEGGGQIDGSLSVLRAYAALGAGYLTLTHSRTIDWADSATDDPRHGVVDADGRVQGVRNLFVAGSAVFPTSSQANPTLTVVAMAARLGAHLRAGARAFADA